MRRTGATILQLAESFQQSPHDTVARYSLPRLLRTAHLVNAGRLDLLRHHILVHEQGTCTEVSQGIKIRGSFFELWKSAVRAL